MSEGVDRLIQQKRAQLRDAFAAHQKAREAVAEARMSLSGPVQAIGDAERIERLESEERGAAARFNAIGEALAALHREKYGEWHITW